MDLFASFWAAVDGKVLNSLRRSAASQQFLSALLENLIFIAKRILGDPAHALTLLGSSSSETTIEAMSSLLGDQIGRIWKSLVSGELKVDDKSASAAITKNLSILASVDTGMNLIRTTFLVAHALQHCSHQPGTSLLEQLRALRLQTPQRHP